MTRIIGGFAGSLRLEVPKFGTRPTSDRVREAIFSALEARDALAGARVLDLYAGSGALGLEAASRGAAHVTLVDKSAAEQIAQDERGAVTHGRSARRGARDRGSSQPVQSLPRRRRRHVGRRVPRPAVRLGGLELVHNLEALVPRWLRMPWWSSSARHATGRPTGPTD